MGFKECYLVPKELYEKQIRKVDPPIPADVKLKWVDHQKRFQSGVQIPQEVEESQLERQMQTILEGIPDVSKRNIASQILTFIASRGGGSVKWTDDFGVLLDNRRIYNLDIREVMRHLAGVTPDIKSQSLPIYERLSELGMKPTLLMFYDNQGDESDSTEKEDWEEQREDWDHDEEKFQDVASGWADIQTPDVKTGEEEEAPAEKLWEKKKTGHPMQLRKKPPRWENYRI